jgi:hypothetical protein
VRSFAAWLRVTEWIVGCDYPSLLLCAHHFHIRTEPPRPRCNDCPVPHPHALRHRSPKIQKLAHDIAHLTLLEATDLSDLLKDTLGMPDT